MTLAFEERVYSALVVSSSAKFNSSFSTLLSSARCEQISFAESASAAKRKTLENQFDFVVINSPLPDEPGTKLAIDISSGKSTVCLMLVKSDLYADMRARVTPFGVFTLSKPTPVSLAETGLEFLAAARERLRGFEKKTVSIEEKMEEIRLVNHAKWLLIENLKMTEQDAHRYIEKQAMDTCCARREVAKKIIGSYS